MKSCPRVSGCESSARILLYLQAMKKWLLLIAVVVAVLFVSATWLLPQHTVVRRMIGVPAAQTAVFRCLQDTAMLRQWMTEGGRTYMAHDSFVYEEGERKIFVGKGMLNVVPVVVQQNENRLPTVMQVIALGQDSAAVEWKAALLPTDNPFHKLKNYFSAKALGKEMEDFLLNFHSFMQKSRNVYGLDISATTVTDTLLVTTQSQTQGYPKPQDYYPSIQQLKRFIAAGGARETNFPMLHINDMGNNRWSFMVAVPIDKRIPDGLHVFVKRMIPGNLLVAEVKGGPQTIEHGIRQFQHYISEKQVSTPAISYQLLVTDRMQVPDTVRWITRLCFPVY